MGMAKIVNIFQLWDSPTDFAKAISRKPDTVRKWKKFRRIPQDAWPDVILAAALKGCELTVEDIIAANAPMKQRGRPAHKIKSSKDCRDSIPVSA